MTAYVLGGAQTDFARCWSREGLGIGDIMRAAIQEALADAALGPAVLDVVHVGNFTGELFSGQGQLGGLAASVLAGLGGDSSGSTDDDRERLSGSADGRRDVDRTPLAALLPDSARERDREAGPPPASRHEAACASGSMAVLAALADLAAGHHEVALVVGVEEMRNVPGDTAAAHLGTAAWAGGEAPGARYLWPALFSRIADLYAERHGLDPGALAAPLAAIARQNFASARKNPLAQTRRWQLDDACFAADDRANPIVEGRLRRHDCGQISDGAAAVVLASPAAAAAWARRRGVPLDALPRIIGWGHRTAPLALADKLRSGSAGHDGAGTLMFPHVAAAAADAWRRARIGGIDAIDLVELHDCFTITELLLLEHLGLAAPGEGARAVASGRIASGGRTPVNPSGGLIGAGHPVGATGVRMLLDAARQVAGRAGECQVGGARRAQTLNIGGSFTTVASFIVER